ncbi:MAG TPA: hypothetical protein VFF06_04535, partial [Polyangia bacterium]|nr:hypothetical protein [Polyangia bacterium]
TQVWMHDNTFSGGGDHPDQANPLGVALKMTPFPNGVVSTVLYDGITDTMRTSTRPNNNMDICLSANGSATFANLHADAAVGAKFPNLTTDATNYTCMLTPLAAVSFPGLQ